MRVRDLLSRKAFGDVVTIPQSATVAAAARLLMRHTIGGLPVVDEGEKLVGFVAERDIVSAVDRQAEGAPHAPIVSVMRHAAPTCSADDDLTEVMTRMTRERLRHLVVLDGGRISGILSVGDLVRNRIEELETETGVLRDYVVAQRARG